MNTSNFSAIAVFSYNRPIHLQETLESLLKNEECIHSILHVYSDAAKTVKEESKVIQVREYLKKVTGFKEVHLHFNEENKGLAKNIIYGLNELFKTNDSLIVMEDDLLVSSDFLKFMNESLSLYKNRMDIFSISGYLYPIEIPPQITDDVILLERPSSLGWATWANKWSFFYEKIENMPELKRNKKLIKDFNKAGNDAFPMLVKQNKGIISSWATRWHYTHFIKKAFCLFPIVSKVFHNGSDGSGTNIDFVTNKFDVIFEEKDIELLNNVRHKPVLNSVLKKYFDLSIIRRIMNFFKFGIKPF